MKNTQDQQLEQQLKSVLDDSVETLDPSILYRLQIARANVLQQENDISPWYKRWPAWASVTGMASICVLVFSLSNTATFFDPIGKELTSNIDVNVFDDETSIELYEEYDFYLWLSQQEVNT